MPRLVLRILPTLLLSTLLSNPAFADDAPALSVRVESDRAVTVAVITDRATGHAVASNGQTATTTSIYYKDVCTAPCDVGLNPGITEFMFYGDGAKATTYKYDFKNSATLTVKTSPLALKYAGLAAVAVGIPVATFAYLNDWGTPAIAGGAVLVAGGIGLTVVPRTKVSISLTPTAAPSSP